MSVKKFQLSDLSIIKKACIAVASADTCCYPEAYDPSKSPLDGHCGAVASMLQGIFGGDIVTGRINKMPHYWNRINGKEYDLTSCQFGGDGYFPLKKGRKVKPNDGLTPLRFLLFAKRVLAKLKERDSGYPFIMENLTTAFATLTGASGVLHTLMEKGWLVEDSKSKEYFPKGGLKLLVKELNEAHNSLTKCFIEYDKIKE